MQPISMIITAAGLDALVNAQDGTTEPIKVTHVGLTETAFTMAPTITAIPDELKRLATVSGQSSSETVIHMTALDSSADSYDVRGFGLYLEDGTLFAVYSQDDALFRKVAKTTFLFVQDLAFSSVVGGSIVFGDTLFLNPPATETMAGVAEIATQDEADAGADDTRIISPRKLRARLLAAIAPLEALLAALGDDLSSVSVTLTDAIAALTARTVTGSGLITGGGNLSASRILTVLSASATDVSAGLASDRAVTPAALSALARSLAQNGYVTLPGCGGLIVMWGRFTAAPNAATATLFPLAFPTACFVVVPAGGTNGGADSQDNPPVLIESSISTTGFSVFSADDTSAGQTYIAIGI